MGNEIFRILSKLNIKNLIIKMENKNFCISDSYHDFEKFYCFKIFNM